MEELILKIDVTCLPVFAVKGQNRDVVMVPFTAAASGPYFTGATIGPCVDTQKYEKDGKGFLSARYMLEGVDASGQKCRIFIENQGFGEWHPALVTDSALLGPWETAELRATVDPALEGVTVRVYRKG